jgi:uncharacterized protein YcfJ
MVPAKDRNPKSNSVICVSTPISDGIVVPVIDVVKVFLVRHTLRSDTFKKSQATRSLTAISTGARVGGRMGAFVGAGVGRLVGAFVGRLVGTLVGRLVGRFVGTLVGGFIGTIMGEFGLLMGGFGLLIGGIGSGLLMGGGLTGVVPSHRLRNKSEQQVHTISPQSIRIKSSPPRLHNSVGMVPDNEFVSTDRDFNCNKFRYRIEIVPINSL